MGKTEDGVAMAGVPDADDPEAPASPAPAQPLGVLWSWTPPTDAEAVETPAPAPEAVDAPPAPEASLAERVAEVVREVETASGVVTTTDASIGVLWSWTPPETVEASEVLSVAPAPGVEPAPDVEPVEAPVADASAADAGQDPTLGVFGRRARRDATRRIRGRRGSVEEQPGGSSDIEPVETQPTDSPDVELPTEVESVETPVESAVVELPSDVESVETGSAGSADLESGQGAAPQIRGRGARRGAARRLRGRRESVETQPASPPDVELPSDVLPVEAQPSDSSGGELSSDVEAQPADSSGVELSLDVEPVETPGDPAVVEPVEEQLGSSTDVELPSEAPEVEPSRDTPRRLRGRRARRDARRLLDHRGPVEAQPTDSSDVELSLDVEPVETPGDPAVVEPVEEQLGSSTDVEPGDTQPDSSPDVEPSPDAARRLRGRRARRDARGRRGLVETEFGDAADVESVETQPAGSPDVEPVETHPADELTTVRPVLALDPFLVLPPPPYLTSPIYGDDLDGEPWARVPRVRVQSRRSVRIALGVLVLSICAALPWAVPQIPDMFAGAVPEQVNAPLSTDPPIEPPPTAPATPDETLTGKRLQSAGRPLEVTVKRLHVRSDVVPISGESGELIPPDDPQILGWWQEGRGVGSATGSSVVTGHTVSGGGGAFDHLGELAPGDRISVRTDAGTIDYIVRESHDVSVGELARTAESIFKQTGPGRLVLITCSDFNGEVYLSNSVVYASPIADKPVRQS